MSIPQNKGFLPSILNANRVNKKNENRSEKLLLENENNSPVKLTTEDYLIIKPQNLHYLQQKSCRKQLLLAQTHLFKLFKMVS